ncbi:MULTISPECIES: TolC family protein [unclassified Marinomonas]|uniref:TolC family protein n=1 Tax=unclassified Marinomonas TaxID=196814 RepID=UPI0007AF2827|nr:MULTISPECIES: TolC family protein [unclassified Marinomonas]
MYLAKRLSIQLLVLISVVTQQTTAQSLSNKSLEVSEKHLLTDLITEAISRDEWMDANQLFVSSIQAESIKSGELASPKLSLGLANMPIDSLDFNQEAMTQLKFSVSQMLPRGDSLSLKKETWQQKGQVALVQQYQRAAQIERDVSLTWLAIFEAKQSIALIEANRGLFEQLLEVSQASYSSALGRTSQGDIIKAELELIRLEDRLASLALIKQAKYAQLSYWLGDLESWPEPSSLPQVNLKQARFYPADPVHFDDKSYLDEKDQTPNPAITDQTLSKQFVQHPNLIELDEKAQLAQVSMSLAKQAYQPQWGLNASYGYRDDAENGMSRSDFLSLGVTLDMPIFSKTAQDAGVKSKQLALNAIAFEQTLALKQMLAKYRVIQSKVAKLNQRHHLYQSSLIPQLKQQEDILLAAYKSNEGPFSDVIKARIESLNAKIQALVISVALQKQKVEFNYLFATSNDFALGADLVAPMSSY